MKVTPVVVTSSASELLLMVTPVALLAPVKLKVGLVAVPVSVPNAKPVPAS